MGMARPIIVVLAAALGCAGDPYHLPVPAEYDHGKYRELGYSEGAAIGRLLFYIPIRMNDTVERATTKAIQKAGGDAITDVTVSQRYSVGLFISHRVTVRGLVLERIDPGDQGEPGRTFPSLPSNDGTK